MAQRTLPITRPRCRTSRAVASKLGVLAKLLLVFKKAILFDDPQSGGTPPG